MIERGIIITLDNYISGYVPGLSLGILESLIHEALIFSLLSCCIQQGGIGGGICRFILANSCKGKEGKEGKRVTICKGPCRLGVQGHTY